MKPQQFMLIVWAWRKLAIIVLVATVSITLIVSLVMPKTYTATTSIYVDVKADPILGALMPAMASPSYMATQTEIIQSSRVAGRVVKLLHIADIPSVFESWKEDTGGKISVEEYYGALLLRGLIVQPGRGSNIINLSFSSNDARFAASAANAFAQATLETNIELRVDPARAYAVWFDERLKSLRDSLKKAQEKLSAYQQEAGIAATSEKLDQETTRLDSLNAALSASEAQKADISSREKSTANELSPDVMQSGLIQNIKAEIAKAEARLSEISSNVGRNHPQRLQLEAQIAGMRQQMAEEIGRISGGVTAASRVSTQKGSELRVAIEAQKKRVLDLRAQHDQIDILKQDVETAQRAYEAVAQRMSQTALESHSQQTNLSVLSPAGEPTTASKPKILVNVAASILVGLLLGIGAAIGREFLDRRVRHRDDLVELEDIPFLGVLRPKTRYQFLSGRWAAAFGWLVRKLWDRRRSARSEGVR
jgi:chain length determinant protein EpsF